MMMKLRMNSRAALFSAGILRIYITVWNSTGDKDPRDIRR